MEKEKRNFQEWLNQLAEKEGVKLTKIHFISNNYTAEAKNGTIKIPTELFSPVFRRIEREAVGAHELAHLKYRHRFVPLLLCRFPSLKRYRFNCEFEADKFAADVTSPAAVISFLEKTEKVREKWRKKNFIWRIRIWCRLKSGTHPSIEERKKRLQKISESRRRQNHKVQYYRA